MIEIPRFFAFAVLAGGSILGCGAVDAQDYPVGPGDVLDISVFARPELSRTYRVRSDGSISLHLVGAVDAAGKRPAELEAAIEDRLSERLDGSESVTLEVASYRPVIVSGAVQTPGAVPFSAGMDVRSAVAMAGGFDAGENVDDTSLQMRIEDEAAQASLFAARLVSLEVTRARLIAARDEEETPDIAAIVAERLGAEPDADLTEAAANLLSAREVEQMLRSQFLAERERIAANEVDAFAERRKVLEDQLATLEEAIATQDNLRSQGLATSERLLSLSLDTSQVRADILEAIGLEAAARQNLQQAETADEAEKVQQRAEISEALASTEAAILETRTQLERSRDFVIEFGGPTRLDDDAVSLSYLRHERTPDGITVTAVDADTLLMPGDGLEVVFVLTGEQ